MNYTQVDTRVDSIIEWRGSSIPVPANKPVIVITTDKTLCIITNPNPDFYIAWAPIPSLPPQWIA